DSEREVLARKADSLELKLAQQKKDHDNKIIAAREREEKLSRLVESLRQDSSAQSDQSQNIHYRFSNEIKEKDDRIVSLDTKVELLRGEIDRRGSLIKELKEVVARHEADGVGMTAYIEELQRSLKEKEAELNH